MLEYNSWFEIHDQNKVQKLQKPYVNKFRKGQTLKMNGTTKEKDEAIGTSKWHK